MATLNPMVPTPTAPKGMSQEEAMYRGVALSQLNILRQQMQLGGLNSGRRSVKLDNGVEIHCNICFNKEDVFVRVPSAGQNEDTQNVTLPYLAIYNLSGEVTGEWFAAGHYHTGIRISDAVASKTNIKSLGISAYNDGHRLESSKKYSVYYPQYWTDGTKYTQWSAKNRYYRLYYSFTGATDYYSYLGSLANDPATNSTSRILSIINKDSIRNITCDGLVYYAWLVSVEGMSIPCYLTYTINYSGYTPVLITPTFKYIISSVEYSMVNTTSIVIDHSVGIAFDSTGKTGKGISKVKTVNDKNIQTLYSFSISPEFSGGKLTGLLLGVTEQNIDVLISGTYDEAYPYGDTKDFTSYAELYAWNAELHRFTYAYEYTEIVAIDYDSDDELIKCFAQSYELNTKTVKAIAHPWASGTVTSILSYDTEHLDAYVKYFFSDSEEYLFTSKRSFDSITHISTYEPTYYINKIDLRLKDHKIYGLVSVLNSVTTVQLFSGGEVFFSTEDVIGLPAVGVVKEQFTSIYQPRISMQSFVVLPKSSLSKDTIVFFSYQYALDCAVTYCNIDSVSSSPLIESGKFTYCSGLLAVKS